ncbi:MAG: hypothetical protein L3J74_07390 [Bacteroidales bacterium]|nr:hypothetical protein [Bacteroidales bacterium]
MIETAYKTFEFELALCNIDKERTKFKDNFLIKYLEVENEKKIKSIVEYIDTLPIKDNKFSEEQHSKIALLLWKSLPAKAEFAQDFAIYINDNIEDAKSYFCVPDYINRALTHIIGKDV